LYIPNNYDRQVKYPLILTLHGVGESGTDNNVQITKNRLAEIWAQDSIQAKQHCFIVSPQCPATSKWVDVASWTNVLYKTDNIPQSAPLAIALDLLDSLIREFPLDTNRLYVTGLSMGGFGTWDLITRHPSKFAAAIPMSGGCDTSKASLIKNIPIWAFHGALDPTVPPAGTRTMTTLLKTKGGALLGYTVQYNSYFANSTVARAALADSIAAGKKLIYCEYTDGVHDIWTKSYNEPLLAQWLFMQKKQSGSFIAPLKTSAATPHKETSSLFKVFGANPVKTFFPRFEPGALYAIEIFDPKGVLIVRKNFDPSTFLKAAIRSLIGTSSGIRIIKLTKLDKKF
jgi:predicted peptidase